MTTFLSSQLAIPFSIYVYECEFEFGWLARRIYIHIWGFLFECFHIYTFICAYIQCAMSERGATHKFAFLAYTAHKTTHSRCYIWTLKLHTHTHIHTFSSATSPRTHNLDPHVLWLYMMVRILYIWVVRCASFEHIRIYHHVYIHKLYYTVIRNTRYACVTNIVCWFTLNDDFWRVGNCKMHRYCIEGVSLYL